MLTIRIDPMPMSDNCAIHLLEGKEVVVSRMIKRKDAGIAVDFAIEHQDLEGVTEHIKRKREASTVHSTGNYRPQPRYGDPGYTVPPPTH